MTDDTIFMTRTMARIQETQGGWANAAKIYRHLLSHEPENLDLQAGLKRAESRLAAMEAAAPEKLARLFEEWLELLFLERRAVRLKRLQARMRQ